MKDTPRLLRLIGLILILLAGLTTSAGAQKVFKAHAIAMHGQPKYAPGFKHFDYVNPNAPKGGTVVFAGFGSYDSLNPFILKGRSASGLGGLFDTLLTRSLDEAFTEYGLLAETVEWPEDRSWVAFTLRSEARWHDGKPVTVEDVIWTLETLKTQGHPFYRQYYQDIERAVKVGEGKVGQLRNTLIPPLKNKPLLF